MVFWSVHGQYMEGRTPTQFSAVCAYGFSWTESRMGKHIDSVNNVSRFLSRRLWDQPAIPTFLPPVTSGFRQIWLGLACVGKAGVGIAVCTRRLCGILLGLEKL